MGEFLDEFTLAMQGQTASIYFDNFSEPQLADLVSFFKLKTGQAYLLAAPALMLEGARMAQIAG